MQLNMNKFITIAALCLTCIFMSGCDNDDSPEISPIEFGQRDYTIRYGTTTRIPFTGGGGAYGLTASDPDVLGKYNIDAENHQLVIFPASAVYACFHSTSPFCFSNNVINKYFVSYNVQKVQCVEEKIWLNIISTATSPSVRAGMCT